MQHETFDYQIQQPRDVPTEEAKQNSRQKRKVYQGKGIYQIGREEEKVSLVNHLINTYNLQKDDAEDLVYGVPNAKFAWYNRVIKDIDIVDPKNEINKCDAQLVRSMWSATGFKEAFNNFLVTKNITETTSKVGHPSYPTRSNMPISCEGGVLKTRFKNPGVYNYETGQMEHYNNYDDMYKEIGRYNGFDRRQQMSWDDARNYYNQDSAPCNANYSQYNDQRGDNYIGQQLLPKINEHKCECTSENPIPTYNSTLLRSKYKQFISEYQPETEASDNQLMGYLSILVQEYLGGSISAQTLHNLRKKLQTLESDDTNTYIRSLLQPHLKLDAKIPQSIPMPTASFQIKDKFMVTLNAGGNAAVVWNPFYLSTAATYVLGVNNNAGLTGTAASNFFLATQSALQLPFAIYSEYRLVSASLTGKYLGSKLNAAGRIDVSTDYSGLATAPIAAGTAIPEFQRYGNFSQIQNAFFYDSVANSDGSMVSVNWFPTDDQMRAFKAIGTINNDSPLLLLACMGGQASVPALEITIVSNFEAIVENEFMDYIPTTTYKGSLKARESAKLMIDNAVISGDRKQMEGKAVMDAVKDLIVPGPAIGQASQSLVSNYLDWLTSTVPGFKFVKDLKAGAGLAQATRDLITSTSDIYSMVTNPALLANFGIKQFDPAKTTSNLEKISKEGKTDKEREDAEKLKIILQQLLLDEANRKKKRTPTDKGDAPTPGGATAGW